MPVEEIIRTRLFFTAGACGPCRFGTYVTEYRKALRDAGFDGFRVMLFQQQGGLRQATGEDAGLELSPRFFITLLKALVAGDVVNLIGYRIRPYELEPGSTDRALEDCKQFLSDAFMQARAACSPRCGDRVAGSRRCASTACSPSRRSRSSASSGR